MAGDRSFSGPRVENTNISILLRPMQIPPCVYVTHTHTQLNFSCISATAPHLTGADRSTRTLTSAHSEERHTRTHAGCQQGAAQRASRGFLHGGVILGRLSSRSRQTAVKARLNTQRTERRPRFGFTRQNCSTISNWTLISFSFLKLKAGVWIKKNIPLLFFSGVTCTSYYNSMRCDWLAALMHN